MYEQKDLEQLNKLQEGTFAAFCGLQTLSLAAGACTVALEVQPHHLNPGGTVHGGMVFTLIDNAAGLAAFTAKPEAGKLVTQNASVNYLRPARGGTIRAKAQVLRCGRSTGLVQVDVVDEKDTLLVRSEVSVFYGTAGTNRRSEPHG